MDNNLPEPSKLKVWQALRIVLFVIAIFLVIKAVGELKGISYIGKNPAMQNTITVSGKGEEVAIPDIAMVTFDVSAEAATVEAAQTSVTERTNDIIKFLDESGIDREKDIKTINYSVYPRYEYETRSIPPIYPGEQKLAGYVVTHGIEIKIRETKDAGKILQALGSKKVTNVSGLSFVVEDEEEVLAAARKKAIDDAREKAMVLAKDLGVKLVRIVSFSEGGEPVYYMKESRTLATDAASAAPTPDIPTGENKFVKNVTIVYEIR